MARYRKSYRKRGVKRRLGPRKRMRSRYGTMRIRRNLKPSFLSVTRKVYCGTLNFSSTSINNFYQYVATSLDRSFRQFDATLSTMSALPNLAEYQALFEQYRINALKYEFFPRMQDVNTRQDASGTTRNCPLIWICKDKTMGPGNIPTGPWDRNFLNKLLENGNGRVYRGDKKFTIFIKRPHILEQVSSGATRTVGPQWLDLNDVNGTITNHRGFHMFAYNTTFDTATLIAQNMDVMVTYYLQFRNPK